MRDSIDTMLDGRPGPRQPRRACDRRRSCWSRSALPPTSYDDVVLAAPVPALAAAVRPLLDNAERHGVGAPRVEVSPRGPHGGDRGRSTTDPASPRADLETVFEPGHTTARATASGLGLPLARRMARAVGADLVARPGPGGRFEVRAPAPMTRVVRFVADNGPHA